MASGRLNLHERYRIHALHDAGYSLRDIALHIDRAPSTVCRELHNSLNDRYRPERAQRYSERRRPAASARPRIDAERRARVEMH